MLYIMTYYAYGRLKFCYQLLAFLTGIASIILAIIAIVNTEILYGCATAVTVMLTALFIKRSEMYQTKMDNWSYKHYLDNE